MSTQVIEVTLYIDTRPLERRWRVLRFLLNNPLWLAWLYAVQMQETAEEWEALCQAVEEMVNP